MENTEERSKLLMLKYLAKGCMKMLYFTVPLIDEIYMNASVTRIFDSIKVEDYSTAKDNIQKLKTKIPLDKLIFYFTEISSFLTSESLPDIPEISKVSGYVSIDFRFKDILRDVAKTVDYFDFMKFLNLAEEVNNFSGAAYEVIIILLNFFKSMDKNEPYNIKNAREDLEYVNLIQMYLNGSKDLPERRKENFNYALLSEFLHKDDLTVLKSIENYLDSAENKALGAAGTVAQSIEKEDLEPGVKKVKKDIQRIESLED